MHWRVTYFDAASGLVDRTFETPNLADLAALLLLAGINSPAIVSIQQLPTQLVPVIGRPRC